jgi:cob(I)alamin adenosyltransferase
VARLEERLDHWNVALPTLKEFILPGGNMAAASTHLARTICRRAERDLVRLHRETPLDNLEMLRYLNRLSDLLFVIARVLARTTSTDEPMWEHKK